MELITLSLLKASLLLGITQLLVVALHRLSAAAKHLLLTAGLAAFVIVPLLAFFGPAWKVTVETPAEPTSVRAAQPALAVPSLPDEPVRESGPGLADVATVLWMLVAACVLARLMRSALRLRAITASAVPPSARLDTLLLEAGQRLAIDASVRLLRSDRVSVPMVWGVRSGTLLLPVVAEEWSDEQLRATFLHELGHLQRLDYVSLGVMNVVAALLWFHPQVWLARRRALMEGERACDDLVLRAGETPSVYASHLLHVARLVRRREPLAALLAMSRPSQLEGRMSAILSPSTNRQAIGGKLLMISLASFIAVLVPLTAVHIAAQPSVPVTPRAVVAVPAIAPVARVAPVVATATVVDAKPVLAPAAARPVVVEGAAEVATVEPVLAAVPAAVEVAPVAVVAPVEVVPDTVAIPAIEPVPAVPAAPPAAVRVLTNEQIGGRAFRVVANVEARSYTLKLNRPVNTGEPSRNPAETVAIERLLRKASARQADAVTNVKCMREIRIGLTWPTAVVCQADAIAFE
jgi:beta-lactamase regulating signal transducer with metallopeptidase domain